MIATARIAFLLLLFCYAIATTLRSIPRRLCPGKAKPMHPTSALRIVFLALTFTTVPMVRADRPGSYDILIPGKSRIEAVARRRHRKRPRFSKRKLARRSSIGLFIGTPSPSYYIPFSAYRSHYPSTAWSFYGRGGLNYAPGQYAPGQTFGGYYLPPSYAPAELHYGPRAVHRFLGTGTRPPAATVPRGGGTHRFADAGKEDVPLAERLRQSNAEARKRAGRFLGFGDAHFAKQRYHQAAQRYRSAIEAAPDLAAAYYRQGFALIPSKQYRLAAKALRIGVELDPDLLLGDRLLEKLYGDNHMALTSHLEQLAEAALEEPENGDLLFVVGCFLQASGRSERALPLLREARETGGEGAAFLEPLIKAVGEQAEREDDGGGLVELET